MSASRRYKIFVSTIPGRRGNGRIVYSHVTEPLTHQRGETTTEILPKNSSTIFFFSW